MTEIKYCTEDVHDMFGVGFHRCEFKAKPGSDYCGVHSPEAKTRRKAKSDERWQQYLLKTDQEGQERDHDAACVAAVESIGGDPETVGELVKALRGMIEHSSCRCGGFDGREIIPQPCDICEAGQAVLAKIKTE